MRFAVRICDACVKGRLAGMVLSLDLFLDIGREVFNPIHATITPRPDTYMILVEETQYATQIVILRSCTYEYNWFLIFWISLFNKTALLTMLKFSPQARTSKTLSQCSLRHVACQIFPKHLLLAHLQRCPACSWS
jgi:hypothetical protein